MNNQILVRVAGDAPIQAPFEHREGLVQRKRIEGAVFIGIELYLRSIPSPEPRRRHSHVEVRVLRSIRQGEVCIQQVKTTAKKINGRFDMKPKGTGG
jgi:hypothetical protein